MIALHLPESLRRFSAQTSIPLNISRLSDLPLALKAENPALAKIVFEESDQLSGFLNLYLNCALVTTLDSAPLPPGDHTAELCVALSGG